MPRPSKTSTSKPPQHTTRQSRRTSRRPTGRAAVRRRRATVYHPALGQTPLEASRPAFWNRLRHHRDQWYASFPLPKINPDYVSVSGILIAFLFVVAVGRELFFVAWVFLLVHIFLDGLDGAIARQYHLRSTLEAKRHGQFMDVVTDRVSEAILFVIPPFFVPWFFLFVLNTVLAGLTIRFQRALILPLRLAFVLVFTLQLIF